MIGLKRTGFINFFYFIQTRTNRVKNKKALKINWNQMLVWQYTPIFWLGKVVFQRTEKGSTLYFRRGLFFFFLTKSGKIINCRQKQHLILDIKIFCLAKPSQDVTLDTFWAKLCILKLPEKLSFLSVKLWKWTINSKM